MIQYVERKGTDSEKWDGMEKTFGKGDLMPLWVADMDFRIAEGITEAIETYLKTGVIGYYSVPKSYYQAFIDWEREKHGLQAEQEWIRFSPGVVAGFNWALEIVTEPDDVVIVNTPVYYPFLKAVENNHRKLVCSELRNEDGRYSIDFKDFEAKIQENAVKAFLLCSPHNPVSRVWTEEELREIIRICRKYGVIMISDEIHHDMVFAGHKHTPLLRLTSKEDQVMLLTSASKTFNIAGLQNSFVVIPDAELRRKWDEHTNAIRVLRGNPLGYVAAEAAYRTGDSWLSEVRNTIYKNYEYIRDTLKAALPKVTVTPLEGTYLMWLDFGAYLREEELQDFMQNRCGLAFDYGSWFGGNCSGTHIRVNLATSSENIHEAVRRILANIKA